MLVKSIEVPIYSLDIIVCVVNKSFDEAIKKFKLDLELNTYDNDSIALTYASNQIGKLEIYMLLTPGDLTYDTIIHELTHVTSYMCKYRGINYDEENDEPIAYFNGYIGGLVMGIIDKFRQELIKPKQA